MRAAPFDGAQHRLWLVSTLGCRTNRDATQALNLSAGISYSKISRGRPLRRRATQCASTPQVGSLRRLSQQTIGVLIGTALPRTLRMAEVNVEVVSLTRKLVDASASRNALAISVMRMPSSGRRRRCPVLLGPLFRGHRGALSRDRSPLQRVMVQLRQRKGRNALAHAETCGTLARNISREERLLHVSYRFKSAVWQANGLA
jgi:hypothetical protein